MTAKHSTALTAKSRRIRRRLSPARKWWTIARGRIARRCNRPAVDGLTVDGFDVARAAACGAARGVRRGAGRGVAAFFVGGRDGRAVGLGAGFVERPVERPVDRVVAEEWPCWRIRRVGVTPRRGSGARLTAPPRRSP
jgi:hypothetical protein